MTSGLFSLPFARLGAADVATPATSAAPQSFIAGSENVLVRSLLRTATSEVLSCNPLVLCGGPGTGKSTLAETLAARRSERFGLSNVIATTITALNSFLNTLLGLARWPDVRRRVPCLRGHWDRAGRAELDGSGRSCCTGRSERSDEHDCRGGGQSALSGYVASADDACRTRRCSFRVSARSPADVFASVAWDSTTSRMGRLAARRAYRAASRPEHQGRVTAAPFYEAGRRSSGPLALGAMRAPSTIHPPTPG